MTIRIQSLHKVLFQGNWNSEFIVHQLPIFHEIFPQKFSIKNFLFLQEHILKRFHHLGIAVEHFWNIVYFLLVHFSSIFEVPFLEIIDNSVFVLIQDVNRYISHFLLFTISVLFSSIVNCSSLVFFEHLLMNLVFEFVLILAQNWVQFQKTFWQKFDSFYLVNLVIILSLFLFLFG